jgi:hypothetical protein
MNRSFHTCIQDIQITRTTNSNDKADQMLRLQHIQSMSLTKLPLGQNKLLQSMQQYFIYSKRGLSSFHRCWPGGEACLAFFLLLEPAFWTPLGCWIIYGNERQAWVDLWLLLDKWGKIWHVGYSTKKAWHGFDLPKVVVMTYAKSWYESI